MLRYLLKCKVRINPQISSICHCSQQTDAVNAIERIAIGSSSFTRDHWTNVTPKVLSRLGTNLHIQKNHPINLTSKRAQLHFESYRNNYRSPLFTVVENLHPVVTTYQNFDSVLVPASHVSRNVTDTYYINSGHVLRTHTSAHQLDLISSGLDAFLVVGDCYRRDEIDPTHYPVFHQMEGVRLFSEDSLFYKDVEHEGFESSSMLEENGARTDSKQEHHTSDAAKVVELNLKETLSGLARHLFGAKIEMRWVSAYFPFTHPSWELEIEHGGKWVEVVGCGIIEQKLLQSAGVGYKIGWAFGIGLDRLAMLLHEIPDIRLMWSKDSGFLSQFNDRHFPVKYKPISLYPQCFKDISFWLPQSYSSMDFFDIVRSIGGDLVEQVYLKDEYVDPKTKETSHCYGIVYRHMERTLTNVETNIVHNDIAKLAIEQLAVKIR